MANNAIAGSVQACAVRLARLGADGAPAAGANNLYVTEALVRIVATNVYKTGAEHTITNGRGEDCVYYKAPDTLRRQDLELAICTPDPELHELLIAGFELLTDGGNTVGGKFPELNSSPDTDHGVSIEAWSRAMEGETQDGWWRHVWTLTRNWRPGGERRLEDGPMAVVLNGEAYENAGWYDGPEHDWYDLVGAGPNADADRVYQYVRDAAIPEGVAGYQSIGAS